ncbi:MAG: hypothetical protein M5U26_10010 [Planctomycetota bacterium]|nr:hypothetical protein [Planctomycetota bacterium]
MPSSPRFQSYLNKAPLVVAFAWLGFAAPQARAETVTVDTSLDTVAVSPSTSPLDGSGNRSLRSALQYLNARLDIDDDEIVLPAGLGTYTLTRANPGGPENSAAYGDLDVTRSSSYGAITIRSDTPGTQAVIDGGMLDRVFDKRNSGATLTLRDLLIMGGLATDDGVTAGNARGGGILAYSGTLTLDHVAVSSCVASGANGTLGAAGGSASGGGLYAYGSGTVNLINASLLQYCNALGGDGGAGAAGAPGNAGGAGGAGGVAQGGGFFLGGGTLSVTDSTVSENSANAGNGGAGGAGGAGQFTGPSTPSVPAGAGGAGGAGGASGGRHLHQFWNAPNPERHGKRQ